MRSNRMLKQMLGLAVLTAALWLLYLYGRVVSTPILILTWGVATGLLTLGLWQSAKTRRRVWIGAYLQPKSATFRFLRGGLLMGLGQGLVAIVMATYLLLAVLRLEDYWQWVALLSASLALPVTAAIIARLLRSQVVADLREELSLRFAMRLLAAALLLYLVWHAYGAQYPDFREASLEQAVWYDVSIEQARSPLLLTLLEIAAATDGLHAWLAQHLMPAPGSSVWQAAVWCIVLAQEALFVWSYLLLCRGVIALSLLAGASDAKSVPEDFRAIR